jgi:hypothetical protein
MTTLSEMFDSFLVCTDHQFYFDKAIEKGILSPEKDAHNYAGHFMFMHLLNKSTLPLNPYPRRG